MLKVKSRVTSSNIPCSWEIGYQEVGVLFSILSNYFEQIKQKDAELMFTNLTLGEINEMSRMYNKRIQSVKELGRLKNPADFLYMRKKSATNLKIILKEYMSFNEGKDMSRVNGLLTSLTETLEKEKIK